MSRKKSFVLYCENLEQVSLLSDTQAGKLFKALMRYADSGETPEFSNGLLQMAFSFMSAQIRRDLDKWEETCQIRSEVGKKGGAPKGNRNAAKKQPKQPKQPDNENVYENENDNVTVCESENVAAPEIADAPSAPDGAQTLPTQDAHTQSKQIVLPMQAADILELADGLGISWDIGEAQRFLDYNRNRGRKDGWDFAIQRWEEHRGKCQQHTDRPSAKHAVPQEDYSEYEALANRFLDDDKLENYVVI